MAAPQLPASDRIIEKNFLKWFQKYIKALCLEQDKVVLDGENIVMSNLVVSGKEPRRRSPEDYRYIPSVADFTKYMSLMNGSTFHDDSVQSSLLDEISVHCRGSPIKAAAQAAAILPPAVPPVFNKWNSTNTTDYQKEHYTEYRCLPSENLDVTLKIPSSLIKLLDQAVRAVCPDSVNSSSSSHKVTVNIDIATDSDDSLEFDLEELKHLKLNTDSRRPLYPMSYVITDVNALLALIVVLKCYPERWWEEFFWDAWLAVTIQMHILGNLDSLEDQLFKDKHSTKYWKKINVTEPELFPSLWMTTKGVFYAERLVDDPRNVKYLLLGQDPVATKASRKATGIAFHNIGDNNPSITGMSNYHLDCKGNKPKEYCKQRPGLLLVNTIRCIFEGGKSMDGNICHLAWTAYTLKLAHYFGTHNDKDVMVFCNPDFKPCLTDKYLPEVVPTNKLLRVPHPTKFQQYIKKYTKDDMKIEPIRKIQKELKDFTKTISNRYTCSMQLAVAIAIAIASLFIYYYCVM